MFESIVIVRQLYGFKSCDVNVKERKKVMEHPQANFGMTEDDSVRNVS